MLLSGIEGTLFNLDPLIKADGYYALSQYLGVDNLREDSFAFLKVWARRYLLLEDVEFPSATRRLRRIYLIYGSIAFVYSVGLLTLSMLFMKNVLIGKLGNWGYPAYAVVLYLFVVRRMRKGFSAMGRWAKGKWEAYMAWRSTRTQQAAVFGVLLLLFIPPVPAEFSSDLVLEPHREARVRAEVSGLVTGVYVQAGDRVTAGQVIATLDNPGIEAHARILKQELALSESALRTAQSQPDAEKAATFERDRVRLAKELDVARRQQAALQLRTTLDGIVRTPELEQKIGKFLDAGEDFCEIVDDTQMKARILVSDTDLERASVGAPVSIKMHSFSYRTFTGRVEQILPAATKDRPIAHPQKEMKLGQELTNYFAVVMHFPNADGSLVEGMTGTAKIGGKQSPLAFQMGRALWRWFRSQIW